MLLVSKVKDIHEKENYRFKIVEGYFMPKRTWLENNSISWKNISPCYDVVRFRFMYICLHI